MSATGGTPAYTYSWAPSGGTAATATGLTAGTYTVTVTDANGCEAMQSFTITQPTQLVASASAQTNIACNGGSNGSATVSATGGAPAYTYSWAPSGGTGATASGLAAGTYSVTVTDANSCTTTQSFTLTEPAILVASAGSQTNVSCNNGSNGSATVNATGGTGTYTYSWSPSGGTAATASGLAAGTYIVTVTDANSCTTTQSFTLTEPASLVANPVAHTNVSCFGGTNGSATVSATGGTGTYTYAWAPSGGTAATASGLAAGTYTVTVTDANSCTTTQSFTLTEPSVLVASAGSQTNVSCNGGSNGSATVNATGGAGGYTYSWWPSGGTAATASGLIAGTYTVTVTDANGCTATTNYTITQPAALNFTTTTFPGYDFNTLYSQNIDVIGGTGVKIFTVTTGDLPSGFILSPFGTITGTSTQIADSNFTVTVTDGNSCTASYDFTLKLNQIPITVTATASQIKVYGDNDPDFSYTVTPNLLPGDGFTGTLSRAPGQNIGSYAINVGSLSAGSKYLMTFVSKDFSITAKPITVTATAKSKTYGDADPALTYTVTPALVTGDSFSGGLSRATGESVGTHAINQGTLALNGNYTLNYTGSNLTIAKKTIAVTATVKNKTYGDADPALTYTFAPALVTGDSFTGSLSRAIGENVGTYVINQGTLALSGNYTLNYTTANLTIGKKSVAVTAAAKNKNYSDADPALTYTFTPALVTGDSFSGNLSRTIGENVGTYAINQGTLVLSGNYTLNYTTASLTIGKKTVTVTATSQTKVYGTADPVFTYSVLPTLVSVDLFTGVLTRAAGENVGTYAIGKGSLSAGANYTITYVDASFSITKANQLITWNQTLGLGCDGETTATLTATSSSGLTVSYTSSNVNIATVSNSLLTFKNYGSATITASQVGNNNYNAAPVVVLPIVDSQPNLIRKQFENILFFDNSSKSFKSYTWYKNGVLVPSQTNQYFKENGVLNGTYYAVATRLDGTFITTCPLTLSPTVEEEYIKLVPNPVKPNANYELLTNISSSKLQNARVEVYSVGGLLMENKTTSQSTVTLKAPAVEGIYIVKMTLANGKYFTKNILVKN